MKSREDLLNEARQKIKEMTVQEVYAYLQAGNRPVLLDVRGLDEWERGHLEGAVHIPRGELETRVETEVADKSQEVIVICAGGVRSLLAGETLLNLGYNQVISMVIGRMHICQPKYHHFPKMMVHPKTPSCWQVRLST
jgi:rhodanese-related sulfurtransferase